MNEKTYPTSLLSKKLSYAYGLVSCLSFFVNIFLHSNMVNADLLPECALAIYA